MFLLRQEMRRVKCRQILVDRAQKRNSFYFYISDSCAFAGECWPGFGTSSSWRAHFWRNSCLLPPWWEIISKIIALSAVVYFRGREGKHDSVALYMAAVAEVSLISWELAECWYLSILSHSGASRPLPEHLVCFVPPPQLKLPELTFPTDTRALCSKGNNMREACFGRCCGGDRQLSIATYCSILHAGCGLRLHVASPLL